MTKSTTQPNTGDGSPLPRPTSSLPDQFKGPFYGHGMGKIFIKTKCGDTPVIDIRGWGYLTGGGALAMSADAAAKVQDQFEQWVIDALNAQAENVSHQRHLPAETTPQSTKPCGG